MSGAVIVFIVGGLVLLITLLVYIFTLDSKVDRLTKEIKYLDKKFTDKYWKDREDLYALLDYLQLRVNRCPSKIVVEQKNT